MLIRIFIFCVVTIAVIAGAAGQGGRFVLGSSSMLPALGPTDEVEIVPYGGSPNAGDIVAFKLPRDDRTIVVKRLVGLPGDEVVLRAGVLFLNGMALARMQVGTVGAAASYRETLPSGTQYVVLDDGPNGPFDNVGPFKVPVGHYFVLGDNRDQSQDSRSMSDVGFVPAVNIVGRVEKTAAPAPSPTAADEIRRLESELAKIQADPSASADDKLRVTQNIEAEIAPFRAEANATQTPVAEAPPAVAAPPPDTPQSTSPPTASEREPPKSAEKPGWFDWLWASKKPAEPPKGVARQRDSKPAEAIEPTEADARPPSEQPKGDDNVEPLLTRARELTKENKIAEAIPLAEQALKVAEAAKDIRPDQLQNAVSLLSKAYFLSGSRVLDALPLAERFVDMTKGKTGLDAVMHPVALMNLDEIYKKLDELLTAALDKGDYTSAVVLIGPLSESVEKRYGPDHQNTKTIIENRDLIYKRHEEHFNELYRAFVELDKQNKAQEALAVGKEIAEVGKGFERRAPDRYGDALTLLAEAYLNFGQYAEAEPHFKKAVELIAQAFGPESPVVANRRDRLGKIYEAMGYMSEAEEQYKLALGIRQAGSGQIDSDLGASTNHLGMMLLGQGRGKEALPLIQRSVEIAQAVVVRNDEIQREHGVDFSEAFKQLGTIDTNKGNLADAWNNLGLVLGAEQDYAEAEKAFQKSLKIDEELYGTEHPEIASIRNNLGLIYQRQRQFEKAENEFRTAAQINIKAFGENHPANMLSFQNLGMLDLVRGNYKQAETLLLGAVAGRVKFLGERNPNTAISYSALGGLYFTLSRWAEAYQALGRANDITIKNALREARTPQAGSEVITKSELSGARSGFLLQVVAGHMLAESTPERRAEIDDSNFKIAQWTINSEAGLAVSKMSARFGPDDPTLAGLLRERQDMAARYRLLDGQATEAASQPAGQRDAATIQALHAELAAADKRIHAIDEQLKTNFAKYAAIATPEPLSIKDVQDLLGKRETLLLLLDSPQMGPVSQGTYIWAISKTAARAVKSPIGGAALADRVAALRCGLDASHWIDPSNWPTDDAFRSQRKTDQQQRRDRCRMLLNANYDPAKPVGPVPYDLALAYDLYQVFFSQIADLITGKDLLIIPSGPLQSLPFQVLLTSKPETARPPSSAAYRRANWLVQTNAITNLPSVSSLKALRSLGKSSTAAPKAYFGIGNPKLDGHPGCAKLTAPSFVTCPGEFETASLNQSEGNALLSRAASPAPSMQSVMRNGHTDVGAIRAQCPLPETGFEMRCVAKSLGSGADVVLEGLRASEAILKAEPLDHFGVLHFATHGALAGEAKGLLRGDDEPGLLLTPPKTASEADDGFLSASEVTSLKLNADVVVLSACNTAGGATDDAEALSGLARAFFYAGARALLVSHWQVNSEAAVKLVSRMFAELRAHGNIGRAEALRRSSRVLIESDPASYAAHPAYWAPFVVVGEGGTRAAP